MLVVDVSGEVVLWEGLVWWSRRVGVVERGGVLERLWRGVPPIGEGKS